MFNREDERGEVSNDHCGRVEERDTLGTLTMKVMAYSGHDAAVRNL